MERGADGGLLIVLVAKYERRFTNDEDRTRWGLTG